MKLYVIMGQWLVPPPGYVIRGPWEALVYCHSLRVAVAAMADESVACPGRRYRIDIYERVAVREAKEAKRGR